MKFDPRLHHRRSIRYMNYDYSQPGEYFVTTVTCQRECLFGEIVEGEMKLNDYGQIVEESWRSIAAHFPDVELGTYVIMPNHVHGIIFINDKKHRADADVSVRRGEVLSPRKYNVTPDGESLGGETPSGETPSGETSGGETPPLRKPTLGQIVGYFKYLSTKQVNHMNGSGLILRLWQRNYYEHIIRKPDDHNRIDRSIESNPSAWELDEENPKKIH